MAADFDVEISEWSNYTTMAVFFKLYLTQRVAYKLLYGMINYKIHHSKDSLTTMFSHCNTHVIESL